MFHQHHKESFIKGAYTMIKNSKLLFLLIIAVLFLSACQSQEDESSLTTSEFQELPSSQDGLQLSLENNGITTKDKKINLLIENLGENTFNLDSYYTIEKKEGGQWYIIPFKEGAAFQDDALSLSPTQYLNYSIPVEYFKYPLSIGSYRIVKKFHNADTLEEIVLAIPFSVHD